MNLTVEWVDQNDVYESDVYSEPPKLLQPMVPVIRVATLRRWLELLAQKEPLINHPLWEEWWDSPEYRTTPFKRWLAQRLLAQLPEEGA